MKIAFIIFDGMTSLDFIGVFDPVTRLKMMNFLPDLIWDICSYSDEVRDNSSLCIGPAKVKCSLENYDMIVVPGGFSARRLAQNEEFIAWIKTASNCKIKASVCSGSLLLGAAGFLKGKKATTHPSAFDELKKYCAQVAGERVVEDGDVITARGVTSSIDLGLYLCEKIAGREAREKIRMQMDYEG